MAFRGLAAAAAMGLAIVLAGCGSGSGRSGTDLAVSGVGPIVAANGGDRLTFVMTVSNRGDFDASDLLIRNATLQLSQPGLLIVCSASGGAVCPAQTGASMEVPSLPSGGSLVFEISANANVGASGTISNTMVVSSDTADINSDNNSATVSVTVASNDVGVMGTAPPGPLVDGPATFTMVVSNAGPDTAQGVSLATTTSPNLTLVPSAIACLAEAGAQVPALQPDNTLLSAAIPVGGVLTCTIPVTVTAGTNGVTAVSMTATAIGDSRASNNTATASVSASLINDLSVAGTAAAPSVIGGQSSSFTMVVGNAGPSTAYDVALANTLGTDLTLSGAIVCTPSGGALAPVATVDGGLVSPAIPPGGALSCFVPVTVAAGANGVVFSTFTATAVGEQRPADNTASVTTVAVTSNLGVSHTGSAQVSAGTPATFTARVANPGPGTSSNVRVTWSFTAPPGVAFDTPSCTALGGATCPAVLGPTMTVPSLGAGRTLVFTFTATPELAARGAIVNAVAVTSDEDTDLSNNSASATTSVVDPRNGSYKAYAADGRQYDMTLDFDAASYTMSGNGSTVVRSFAPASGGYTVSGNSRFRAAADILVGGHDFGAGVLPYIAARSFTSGLTALAGSYNLATRIVGADGVARTLPGTAFISGNTLSICESETATVSTVRLCAAGARKDFLNLTVNGNVVTGTAGSGESLTFSVANSGAAKFLLSTGSPASGEQRLRVGVIDSTAGLTFGPPQQGASTTGDWVTTTVVDTLPVGYTAVGTSGTDTASLVAVTNSGSGPFSMLTGTSSTFNGSIFLLQSYPLMVVVGGATAFSPASGLLQLALP
jgi:uncharacterized repeat protein (TIGR01451 family)